MTKAYAAVAFHMARQQIWQLIQHSSPTFRHIERPIIWNILVIMDRFGTFLDKAKSRASSVGIQAATALKVRHSVSTYL
jgi:hypothetical protein